MKCLILLLFQVALVSTASSASWTGSVSNTTDGTTWSIQRHSGTVGFDLSGLADGKIAPISVTPRGRVLPAHNSHYIKVKANDVQLEEHTTAFDGTYRSEDEITLRAEAEKNVNMTITKPSGSNVWTIDFEENWPVAITASRIIDYSGKGINDRDFAGNNLDRVGTGFLYNDEFSKDRRTRLRLDRMNATVVATNDTIIRADLMPTKSLYYEIESHSTGIADLSYKQTDPERNVMNAGEEWYHGTYDINRSIEMKSNFSDYTIEKDWLSCCGSGCSEFSLVYSHRLDMYEKFSGEDLFVRVI